jgi:uncharacterized protein involved in exopolysaccharide biosynthesis
MSDQSFDLIGIFHQLFKKKFFIIGFTVLALIVSIIFCSMQPKGYTSETVFIVKNPLLIDRNFVFRPTGYENREFFAIADDVDHVKTIAKSDGMLWYIIEKFNLQKAYNTKDNDELIKKVRGNFKAVMEDTKNIQLFYTDTDPQRAADIVNEARGYLEKKFMDYFLITNKDISGALKDKVNAMKDTIVVLDASIQSIRATAGNYSQLLPARGNTITPAAAGNAQSAAQMEQLQEIVVLKDKIATDIAAYNTLINEYEVMANDKIHIFYVIQDGYVPGAASHPKTIIITAASAIAALFFSCVLVLFGGFYSYVMEHKRKQA